MPPARNHLFGVDFSGSSTPGDAIWITEAQLNSKGLQIADCRSAVDRLNLSKSASRDTVYKNLHNLIKNHPSAVFGFDFPFSLPKPLIDDVNSWSEHLETLNKRFGSKSAKDFRQYCVGRATVKAGVSGYIRRETDWRYGGQCPYQHQLMYQTYHGQRDLLAPLIANDEARALPMQARAGNLPWLIEVYPAATLSKLGLYRQGYKNRPESPSRRERNIEGFRKQGFKISNTIAKKCRENDDAHDSLTAAVGTSLALEDDIPEDDGGSDIEGQIFA